MAGHSENPIQTAHAMARLEARLADMEMRIAFQDDLMNTLSDQIANQQQTIQRLFDLNRILREQFENLQDPQSLDTTLEPPPPHY